MSFRYRLLALSLMLACAHVSFAQTVFKGKIIDAVTKEPIAGATVQCTHEGCRCGCSSNAAGAFQLQTKDNCCTSIRISSVGYVGQNISLQAAPPLIALTASTAALQEVVVSANRQAVQRSEAPVAIATINHKLLQDAKPTSIEQVLNKISGVNMVNLGNEQHQMSIRQPMTTKSLFLYLEDGIPVRTTGLFNHNALLEMNSAAVKNIEVIKGPSSSLYGSEAIGGVVNFITLAPTALPLLKLSAQGNNLGYRRTDLQTGFTKGKWGIALNGYAAWRRNGFIEYSNFNKSTVTARIDYALGNNSSLSNSLTWLNYESDMSGTIDSAKFASRSFASRQTFTYRNVRALRYRSTLNHQWKQGATSTLSLVYRNNSIRQNPDYAIKNDRRLLNGNWKGNPTLAHGEENKSAFSSYALLAQHRQALAWKRAVVIGGASADLSPTTYRAEYLRIHIDTLSGKYTRYTKNDSVLTQYKNGINNFAGFLNFEFSPVQKLRVVAALRYDVFCYRFNNQLTTSAFSGAPDTLNRFRAVSPKIGATYNFSSRTGVYANYSQGFVPPQVTEMYRGVKVPHLKPALFYNYEIGGWAELLKNRLTADVSLYRLNGTNEIVSMRLDDGSTENRNTGKTSHQGLELGLKGNLTKTLTLQAGAAWSQHRFVNFVEKGIRYSGKEMNGAPHWMHNAEVWYKPAFAKGLRLGVEWQRLGGYFMDAANTTKYKGHHAVHLRAGYRWKGAELWLNVLNATNNYYAYHSIKSASGYSYTPAEPRNFNLGFSYDFGTLLKGHQ